MTIGAVAGLALTVPLTFAMRAIFIGVSPFDPLAFLPMLAALAVVTLVATIVPARRAARIDPVSALRAE
jgi:ABC-type antimicrobial peptide transport system permease subunit